jgi:hypothetical protein
VEGAIAANERLIREAEARLAERNGLSRSRLSEELFLPGGQYVGTYRRNIYTRTVSPQYRESLLDHLWSGSIPVETRSNYEGQWYKRPDGLIFGVRISRRHGITIDIIESSNPLLPRGFKVHGK